MKFAIQGHPFRGKEVIQILEGLGGKNTEKLEGTYKTFYYIDNKNEIGDDHKINFPPTYKLYTLEEFEKEFPFKIGDEVIFPVTRGWASGKVTGLTYVEDQLKYEVDNRIAGYCYIEPHKLSLYPMKEERNITLTLDKAKEWYNKGGELKEVALQAYSEEELNSLPRSWEEFCKRYSKTEKEAYIGVMSAIYSFTGTKRDRDRYTDKNICPSQKSAEAHLAMIQLEQLRDCWWNGWEPDWNNAKQVKHCITYFQGKFKISTLYETGYFLSFPNRKMAEEFLKCFKDLIEQAGDLI